MTLLPAERSASTTPALADQWEAAALDEIEFVSTPEAAEELLGKIKLAEQAIRLSKLGAEREQRWGRVRLMGERRYGELLGPPSTGGQREGHVTGSNVAPSDRKARHEARAVASVPAPVFQEYVDTAPKPSRSGLLREASTSPDPVKVDVTVQVTKLIAQGSHLAALIGEGAVMERVTHERIERTLSGLSYLRKTVDQIEAMVREHQRIRRVV